MHPASKSIAQRGAETPCVFGPALLALTGFSDTFARIVDPWIALLVGYVGIWGVFFATNRSAVRCGRTAVRYHSELVTPRGRLRELEEKKNACLRLLPFAFGPLGSSR